jgi:hypothetical protein
MPDHREWLGHYLAAFKTEEARSGEPLLSMEPEPLRGREEDERERGEGGERGERADDGIRTHDLLHGKQTL